MCVSDHHKLICRIWRQSKSVKFGVSYQHLLICLIGPKGSDKYNPGDLELLLWISMLIGLRLDLTDLASPRRGTASSQGEGFCMGVSREKEGEREEKRESGLKKGCIGGAGLGWGVLMEEVWRSVEDIAN